MTRVFGVMGFPISHSLSPVMHNAAFGALGLDAIYAPFEVSPAKARLVLQGLVAAGIDGFNVTVPLKEVVLRSLHVLSPEVRQIGAVNTVVIRDGRLAGYNTDSIGFLTALRREARIPSLRGHVAVVLGAGGAAKAVIFALINAGCVRVTVANRTVSRAQRLVRSMESLTTRGRVAAHPLDADRLNDVIQQADLLVNATSVGMHRGDPLLIDPQTIHRGLVVFDLVYGAHPTRLIEEARRRGALAVDGVPMLVYQGAESFRLWWRRAPPIGVMRRAVEQAVHSPQTIVHRQ